MKVFHVIQADDNPEVEYVYCTSGLYSEVISAVATLVADSERLDDSEVWFLPKTVAIRIEM